MKNGIYAKIVSILSNIGWKNSSSYWEKRYSLGGTSGAGSYNRLAAEKAEVINAFVDKENIKSVIEWGVGDGNQLSLSNYEKYIGYDVSPRAVEICKEMFKQDTSKEFYCCAGNDFVSEKTAELALSLDVLYHLIEDDVFETYMYRLFNSSTKYVLIYSCDFDDDHARWVKCRKFTDWISNNLSSEWKLRELIKNKYPFDIKDKDNTSWSDFYIYEKIH